MSLYTDPIADMLARIRNAIMRKKEIVDVPYSNFKLELLKKLKQRGFIKNIAIVEKGNFKTIKILLKYKNNQPVIHEIKRVSKPGRRVYTSYQEIPQVLSGLGDVILSTSKGVLTDKEARNEKVGGEIIFTIW